MCPGLGPSLAAAHDLRVNPHCHTLPPPSSPRSSVQLASRFDPSQPSTRPVLDLRCLDTLLGQRCVVVVALVTMLPSSIVVELR
ncbi:unnamed protein product [Arctogadus glacialis]